MSSTVKKLAYSVTELAGVVGVGRSFLYEEIKKGRLKLKKAGRRSLVLIADAEAWLKDLPELKVNRADPNPTIEK